MKNYKDFMHFLCQSYTEKTEDAIGLKYISWSKLQIEDKTRFTKVLSLKDEKEASIAYVVGDYWSADFPIDFNVYPNSNCEIFTDKQSGNHYMIYLEYGGHVPEERCRLIQKKLIKFPE